MNIDIKKHGDYLGNEINIGDTIVYASKTIPGLMLLAEVIKVQDNIAKCKKNHDWAWYVPIRGSTQIER